MIVLGILIMITGTVPIHIGLEAELGVFKYIVGLFFIILGMASVFDSKKIK